MHGLSLIVAERGETDKKVSAEVGGFSLLNFGTFAASLAGHGRGSLSQWERERILRTAPRPLIFARSQILDELSCDETYPGQ